MKDYEGGRDLAELKKFAKDNLGPRRLRIPRIIFIRDVHLKLLPAPTPKLGSHCRDNMMAIRFQFWGAIEHMRMLQQPFCSYSSCCSSSSSLQPCEDPDPKF